MISSTPTQQRQTTDLTGRTIAFATSVRSFIKKLPKSIANLHDTRQLIRSSSSIGARYVEASEAQNPRDFLRLMLFSLISARESSYWLLVIDTGDYERAQQEREALVKEAQSLQRIMGSLVSKARKKAK